VFRRAILLVMAAGWLAIVMPARADAAPDLSVPAPIDATGATDVSAALDAFLGSLPEGATVTFPAGARYRVEGVIRIQNAQNVTIDGNGAEIFADTTGGDTPSPGGRFRARWPRLREHLFVRNATGLTIRDLTIRGPNDDGRFVAALEGQAGIAIYGSTDVVVDDVTVQATHGDGVYIAGQSDRVTVRNSSFSTIGRQGIAPVNASNVLVERSAFDGIARSVIDLEPAVPRWKVETVHIRDNEIGEYRNFALAAGGAGANVTDVWFERNRVTGGNGLAVFAGMPRWLRRGLHVIDNTSTVPGRNVAGENRDGVMQIARIEGVEIRGNTMAVADGPAITLADVCDADIGANDFPGASPAVVESGRCDRTATPRPGPGAAAPATRARGEADDDDADATDWLVAAGLGVLAVAAFLGLRLHRRHSGEPS